MKKLRPWQKKHMDRAIAKFSGGGKIYLSQAVTGGGKTTMGVSTAVQLLKEGLIGRIAVLCPSVEIAASWADKFNQAGLKASSSIDNLNAADLVVVVATYQGGGNIPGNLSTLAILDEIHHAEREAAWGLLASSLADSSKYVLALTGTPWMTKGRIAILDKNGYYKPDETGNHSIVADDTYSYSDDLAARGNDRATVPVECHFFGSTATKSVKDEDGGMRQEVLTLKDVTTENKAEIIQQAGNKIPLGPHVSISDSRLSNNPMAVRLLQAAVNARDAMEDSAIFAGVPRTARPMGLVTCRSINEARCVSEYMTDILGQSVELIVSKNKDGDEKSAERLRQISKGKNLPAWIVSCGMVSEGVDIPQIKVIAFLNEVTTLLFLIQLFGRALRRIVKSVSKDDSGEDVVTYVDHMSITATRAQVFAPAHPAIVRVGVDLERISNRAVEEAAKKSETTSQDEPPKERAQWNVNPTGEPTTFFRGVEAPYDICRNVTAIELDESAMSALGPFWVDLVLDWVTRGNIDAARDEIAKRMAELKVDQLKPKTFSEDLDYDTETNSLRREARRLVNKIRFGHQRFKNLPDDGNTISLIRTEVTNSVVGRWVPFKKLTIEQKRKWVSVAKQLAEQAQEYGFDVDVEAAE